MATTNSDASSHPKSARLEARVSPELKELITRAAEYSGRSLSDFVLTHMEIAARKVVDGYERMHLDQEQSRLLVEALLAPPAPNKKLDTTMAKYRKSIRSC